MAGCVPPIENVMNMVLKLHMPPAQQKTHREHAVTFNAVLVSLAIDTRQQDRDTATVSSIDRGGNHGNQLRLVLPLIPNLQFGPDCNGLFVELNCLGDKFLSGLL